jgi:formamidopyrimidine-DNA glycosylase
MPELPEVETIAKDLSAIGVVGRTLAGARVYWKRTIAVPSTAEFCRLIQNKRLSGVRRRGKFLVIDLADGASLLIHLRMSGRRHWVSQGTARELHEHVGLGFTDGN